jgi:hypothetical protein
VSAVGFVWIVMEQSELRTSVAAVRRAEPEVRTERTGGGERSSSGERTSGGERSSGGDGTDRELVLLDDALEEPTGVSAVLLESTAADRNAWFRQTLDLAGYECPEMPTADPVGDDGSGWRVNCGGTLIYRIAVDAFGNLSATAVPYGDIDPSIAAPVIERGRTLELDER